jgi:H+-transporting ATPase
LNAIDNSRQIIIEDGQVVPGDASLICAYDNPEGYAELETLHHEENEDEPTAEEDSSDDEDEERHNGHAIVACDQSAITGESLAVDKYVNDVVYYTTGCKRGKAYAIVLTPAKTSFVGRTATLVQGAKNQGHFKAIMNVIGTALLVMVVA